MWKKIKDSKFGAKCRELSKHKGALVSLVCLLVAVVIVASVSIATNVTKKKYAGKDSIETNDSSEKQTGGEMTPPTYNNGGSNETNSNADEEFTLSLPISSGTVSKGHDASIQVWNDTLGEYRVHLGIDIVTSEAAPVYAAADGEIARVWDDALMGKCIAIAHDGKVYTIYKNLSVELPENIKEGAKITKGQKIGTVGESAISELSEEPHLHLEMTVDGISVDPTEYFPKEVKDKLGIDKSYEDNTDSGK